MPTTKQFLDDVKKKYPELYTSICSLPESTWKGILGDDWHDISAGTARKRIGELTRVVIARETDDKRSPKWPKARADYLKDHSICAACGNVTLKVLNVHHIDPYSLFPERELDPTNRITLCEESDVFFGINCHFLFGHQKDWKLSNPRVVEVAQEMRKLSDKLRSGK